MEPAADHKQEVELAERGQQGVDPNESKDVTDYRVEVTPADVSCSGDSASGSWPS
jgi:hypothetical protein